MTDGLIFERTFDEIELYYTVFDFSNRTGLALFGSPDFLDEYQDLIVLNGNDAVRVSCGDRFRTYDYKIPPFILGDTGRIAANYFNRSGKGIYLIDIETKRVVDNIPGYAIAGLSPSGKYAFLMKDREIFSIYDVSNGTQDYHSLDELGLEKGKWELNTPQITPAWNPDESVLAFCAASEVYNESRLYMTNPAGGFEQVKIFGPDGICYKNLYKPFFNTKDGSLYIFVIKTYMFLRNRQNRVFSLYKYHSSGQQELSPNMHFFPDGAPNRLISPGGDKIVFIGSPYERLEKVYRRNSCGAESDDQCSLCIDGVAGTLKPSSNELYALDLQNGELWQLTDNAIYKRYPQFTGENEIAYLEKGRVRKIEI